MKNELRLFFLAESLCKPTLCYHTESMVGIVPNPNTTANTTVLVDPQQLTATN